MKQNRAMRGKKTGRTTLTLIVALLMAGFLITASNQTVSAKNDKNTNNENTDACTALADIPLEIRGQAAPGLVNLVWDASGSMLWTMFTDDDAYQPDCGGSYYYIFPEAHYYYSSNTLMPTHLRNDWKTQWSGYNRMYYNPDVNYEPWPRWNSLSGHVDNSVSFHADPDTPRYHPTQDHGTFNLNDDFYPLAADGVQYVNAQGAGFSKQGNWLDYQCVKYTHPYHNDSTATATWSTSTLNASKNYNIYVYIPDNYNWDNSSDSEYLVDNGNQVYSGLEIDSGSGWQVLKDNGNALTTQFLTGQATVQVNIDGWSWQCAYDIAFVPAQNDFTENIIYAHYFTQNADGDTFLVNLDGEISYYEAILDSNGDTVKKLIPMTAEEAENAGIVTGRSYEEERQNFADWYQFYRRRYFTGIAAAGQFIDGWTNIFMRVTSFPDRYGNHENFKRIVSPIDMTVDDTYYDEKDDVLYDLYTMNHPWGGTPLRDGLYEAGEFFEDGVDWSSLDGQSPFREYSNTHLMPYFLPEYGGECQQGFSIVMTDGMWNGELGNNQENIIGNADADTDDNEFDGGVFEDDYSNTAADVAMHFYKKDLHPFPESGNPDRGLKDFVPTNSIDDATHQHMVTYGISFGIPGSYSQQERDLFSEDLRYGNEPESQDWEGWPEPEAGTNTTIDDLWHATINGRGEFISAGDPEKLVDAMLEIKSDIEERLGSAAAVSTNTSQRRVGTLLFQGQFHSSRWSGDLLAKSVDPDTGDIAGTEWSAQQELGDVSADDRIIYTYDGSGGAAFRDPVDGLTANQVDFLRGDRDLELQNGGSLRNRDGKLGDIVHSEPTYHDKTVYVGANDGMLHAFDSESGKELFAYVPGIVHPNLSRLTEPDYRYQYYVDGSPRVKDIGDLTLLVSGLRGGGKGYFALDVTNANPATEDTQNPLTEEEAGSVVKWEYTADDDDDLGYTYSRPLIMKTKAAGWVVVFGNGYNSANGNAVLYVIDIDDDTGSLNETYTIDTGISGCNGIAAGVTGVDPDFDGYADFVYAGDLKGNLWKFDFRGDQEDNWGVAYEDGGNKKPLFTAQNANGDPQPITVAPDIMMHCNQPGYLLIFGTGKHVSEDDFGNTSTQTIYGIWDWQAAWAARDAETTVTLQDKYLGTFTEDRELSNLTDNANLPEEVQQLTLLEQEIDSESGEWLMMTSNTMEWWNHQTDKGRHLGWYFDLPQSGERVINKPMIRSGVAIIASSIPSKSPCKGGGSSVLYALDACSGGEPDGPQFDSNDDDKVNKEDLVDGNPPGGKKIDEMVAGVTDLPPNTVGVTLGSGDLDIVNVPSVTQGMSYWYEPDFGW